MTSAEAGADRRGGIESDEGELRYGLMDIAEAPRAKRRDEQSPYPLPGAVIARGFTIRAT